MLAALLMSSASKTPPGATGQRGEGKLRVSAEIAPKPRFGGVLCFLGRLAIRQAV